MVGGMFYPNSDFDSIGNSLARMQWKYKFALWPRRCARSNNWIWLKRAYHGHRWVAGPGEPILISSWLTPEEFTMFQLQTP